MKPHPQIDNQLLTVLIPRLSSPQFDATLKKHTPQLSDSARFLLKMELKRLAKPCYRVIDLRGSVEGKCQPFEHQGRTHYLDEHALTVFKQQLALYGGVYTQGMFEAIKSTPNHFRVMQQQQPPTEVAQDDEQNGQSTRFMAEVIHYRSYQHRREERMNFVVALEVADEQGNLFSASSIDLSVSGLQLKTQHEINLAVGQRLTVYFRGLEKDYVLDKRGVQYQVLNQESRKGAAYVSLCRANNNDNQEFDAFLESFIHGHKRRYKVNLDNTLDAVKAKGYEQYHLAGMAGLPIFASSQEGKLVPQYALLNDHNQAILDHWQHGTSHQLGLIFTDSRCQQWLAEPGQARQEILFTFNVVRNDLTYWYSASLSELNRDHSLMRNFLAFGARQASWRVYLLQSQAIDHQRAHRPLSLPSSVGETVRKQNRPLAPRLVAKLRSLSHLLLLNDITDDKASEDYRRLPLDANQLATLKHCAHPRNQLAPPIKPISFQYRSLRHEPRYKLDTLVEVTIGNSTQKVHSEDISSQGLSIKLAADLPVPTRLLLSFPQLQKLSSKYQLKDILYEVRAVDKARGLVSLMLVDANAGNGQQACRFFTELLDKNRRKLPKDPERQEWLELGEALKHLVVAYMPNGGLFVSRQGSNFVADAISHAPATEALLANTQQVQGAPLCDLSALFTKAPGKYFLDALRVARSEQNTDLELLVHVGKPPAALQNARFSGQFSDGLLRHKFIQIATQHGQFRAYRVQIKRTGKPDTSAFESELRYINLYAAHKALALEDRLWGVSFFCEVQDITAEVLLRYALFAQEIGTATDNHGIQETPQSNGTWQQVSNNIRNLSNS